VWTEQHSDDMRRPLFAHASGWLLHYWRGRNAHWVVSRPDGSKHASNAALSAEQVVDAQTWAARLIEGSMGGRDR
jgi:hypothetical protein